MPRFQNDILTVRQRLPIILMGALLLVGFLAGGASRADVAGQTVIRASAVLVSLIAILFGPTLHFRRFFPLWGLLLGTAVLLLVQLVPLPPEWWQALPGRHVFTAAADTPQPWRPLSLVPGGTINALSSLTVPFAALLLGTQLDVDERARIPGFVLAVATGSMIVGILQYAGQEVPNPFADIEFGEVSGFMANRNHFALLMAIGCLIAPVWAFLPERGQRWRRVAAPLLCLMFVLTTVASGSRAGMILVALGLAAGFLTIRTQLVRSLRDYPKWLTRSVAATVCLAFVGIMAIAVASDRAVGISRLLSETTGNDLRVRSLPLVLELALAYFPAGTGAGAFSNVFGVAEPLDFLSTIYLNHAHNDFIEIVLECGLAGAVLLGAALVWCVIAGVSAWRAPSKAAWAAKLGSASLLLVALASLVDYPARTPLGMMLIVFAGILLAERHQATGASTLPS